MSGTAADSGTRALTRAVHGWLFERHHQSLGLWPWTWTDADGRAVVTLYAQCVTDRFRGDFGALAAWIEAARWPTQDGRPHPLTFYRDEPTVPDWARWAPLQATEEMRVRRASVEVEQLGAAGAPIETVAQLLEANSGLDQYLAMLAPLRHAGHAHRGAAGRVAVAVLRLATEMALHLDLDYAVPFVGPVGGHAAGLSDVDWRAFLAAYGLTELPGEADPTAIFTFGERGWLHAAGLAGDRHGHVLRFGTSLHTAAGYAAAAGLVRQLLGA